MIWFTGCPHFASKRVLPFRNFKNVSIQDEHLLQQINQYVKKEDRLYILGDFAMVSKGSEAKAIRDKIVCRDVRLVLGNHERCTPGAYAKVFQQVGDILEYRWGDSPDQMVVLSHYPLAAWNHSFRGSYNFYSHLHNKCEPLFDHMFPHRRSIDVGVDNSFRLNGEYRPFLLTEILNLLKERRGHSPDRRSFRITRCEKIPEGYRIETDQNLSSSKEIFENFTQSGGKLYFERPNGGKFYLRQHSQNWLDGSLWYVRMENGSMVFSSTVEIPPGTLGWWA